MTSDDCRAGDRPPGSDGSAPAGRPRTAGRPPDDRLRADGGTGSTAADGAGTPAGRPRVLVVEDNPGDARLIREAFERRPREVALTVVSDGAAALEYLRADAPLPSLVTLDRDLPGTGGEEVLDAMREDPELRYVPVVVFTSSEVPEHVRRMYELRANAYVKKPGDAAGFFECIERLDAFWFAEATLPEESRA